jgi:hypothetical protein
MTQSDFLDPNFSGRFHIHIFIFRQTAKSKINLSLSFYAFWLNVKATAVLLAFGRIRFCYFWWLDPDSVIIDRRF